MDGWLYLFSLARKGSISNFIFIDKSEKMKWLKVEKSLKEFCFYSHFYEISFWEPLLIIVHLKIRRKKNLRKGSTYKVVSCIGLPPYAHDWPYTANVYTQTTDLLLFSDVVITHENV